jgi:TP901 family phage tail tape measure protein
LAEARILVRPDTSRFRAELEAELAAVTKNPIRIPVVPVVAGGIAAATAETVAFTSAQAGAAAETQAVAAALEQEAIAATKATAAQSAHARSTAGLARGAGASALTLFGLRGATLAASGAFLAGTAAVVAFSKSLQSAAQLETELNVFRVTAGATADEMDRVSASAKQLGRDITLPGVTANEAATAMTELSKAGLSVRDSLDGARGALQLATAAQIDVKDSTNLVAGALNAFALSGTDAVKVADLLTGAAKESQGEITDMGTALGQAAAVSHQFGVSIEDTVTLLTELAQAGIAGGRAGTSLRVAFLRLVKPPADAAKALKELNVQVRDAQGNLRPQIFSDIQVALQGYTKAQQDATLATIFGADAIRTAGIVGAKGAQAFTKTRDAITEVGLAQEQAAARTQGLEGDIENLSNQVSSLGLTFGTVAKGPVSSFVKSIADTISTVNTAADGLVALGTEVKDLGKQLDQATFSLPLDDIIKATSFLNPLTAQLKVVAGLTKQFGGDSDKTGSQVSGLTTVVDTLSGTFDSLTEALQAAARQLGTQLPKDTGLGVKQIQNVIGGFDAQEVRARIASDNAELVDVLNTEQSFLERQLQRQFVKNRPELKRLIEQSLLGVVSDIATVQAQASAKAEGLKREAEKAASDAAAAVRDREQALLAGFGVARDQQANKIAAAAQTVGLQDDIKRQKQLKALVLQQIAAVRERISIEGGRAAAIVALQAILTQVSSSLQSLAQQQQQAQQAQRAALLQGIDLDISLAQITDNQAAEVRARNRKIAQLNKDLAAEAKLHGKTTVEYKTIRNEIAAQNAALKEIQKEKAQSNRSFAVASFEFLQAQQGFASNLLGNLIPSGATGGLVGGTQRPVQAALQPVAGAAEARSQSGISSGQGNATNNYLRMILAQLKEMNGETKAPEAARQWQTQRNTMDGVGGG